MAFTPGTRAVISFVVEGVQGAQRQINSLGGSMDGLGGQISGSLKGLAAFAGVGLGIGALAEQVMEAQREFDKLNATLTTATGSTASAAQAFDALQAFASTTPYSVKEATEAFITMRNLGLDPSEKALRSYGNTAAAMGKDLSQMVEAVADASAGEFERLKEFGISATKNGSQVSLTFQGMTKKIGNSTKEIQAYLQSIGDINFAGAMEKRANTLDGAISNLGDTWQGTMRTIAQNGIGDEMQSGVVALANSLSDLSAILDVVGGTAKKEGQAVKEASVLHAGITAIFETLAVAGVNLAYVLTAVGKDAGGLAATAVALAKGDLATAKAIGNMRRAEAEQERKDVDEKSAAILGASAKANKLAADEAAARQKSGQDRLGQFAIELTVDQKRAKAKQDIFDIENKLNGVNADTSGELAKLKTALDTGAISASEYAKYVAKINKETIESSTAYKDQAKQLDMSAAGIKRRAEAQALMNQREQEHIEFLRSSGQIDEEGAIKRIAAAQVQDLNNQKAAAEGQLSLAKRRIDSQKEQADLAGQIGNLDSKILNRKTKEEEDLFSLEQKRYRLAADNYADSLEAAQAQAITEQGALRDQLDQNAELGKTPTQIAAITAARLRDLAVRAEENADIALGLDLSGRMTAAYTAQADALRKRADAVQAGVAIDLTQATQLLEIMAAIDDAAQSAAAGMADSFGQVGTAIGGLTTALTGYGRTQAAIAAQLAAATKDAGGDTSKIQRANASAAQQSAQAQIKSYGDMASAAKGFFKEGSKGYTALQATEKTFRAFEMAMAIKNMVVKSGLVEAFTGLFVAGKATETAATLASVGPDVAASMAKGTAAAAAGVAGQAAGDPYTAWARMAAMAAVMAGLGFAVMGASGSGGGGETAEEVQKKQGTGSVFGDSSAKSDSIARSIALSAANSNIELNYTAGMLSALKSIDASMSGLANLVVGATGVTDGSNLGIQTGQLNKGAPTDFISSALTEVTKGLLGPAVGGAIAKVINNIWGKTTQNIVDSGLQLGGSVSDLQSGKGFSQYASVDTTKSSWFGLSKKTSNSVQTAGLDSDLSSQFGLIFTNLEDALTVAAGSLGIGANQVGAALDSLVINTTKVSLKDLKGDDLTAAINGVISKTMDEMAEAAIPGLDRFRKVGEGYAETVVRIATDYANVDGILMGIGKTFGWVGTSSIASRENLIALAGGIDELASQTKSFASNFLSQAEQLAPVQQYVNDQLASMGLAYVKTREDFKNVIMGLNLTDPAAQQTYASLMALQEAFAKTHAATVDLTKSEQEIADERKDLQTQWNELTMTASQLEAVRRDEIAAQNRGLYDQVKAAQAAKDANDAAKTSLGEFLSSTKAFAESVAGFNGNLMTGTLSSLTPEQQYAEARRQFEQTKAAAAAGDKSAQNSLQAIENTFLTLSQKVNGGDAQYSSDMATVMQANDQLAEWAAGSVDVAQASLDALNAQVAGIDTLNVIMSAVAQNLQYLPVVAGTSSSPSFTPVVLPAIDYSSYGTASQAPLLAAIKALQDEVKALRADAQKQAGDDINSNIAVTLQAADKIVDGARQAASDAAYAAANSTRPAK
jgi:hypothetical protein